MPLLPRPAAWRPIVLAVAALAAAWALAVAFTGGTSIDVGGVRLSSRSAARPALVAALLVFGALWRTSGDERRRLLHGAATAVDRRARALALLLALVAAATSAVFGSHVAGASDASGYVSQSRLWAAGQVTRPAPVVTDGPWPDRGWAVAPLGYRPTVRPDELGPTYAPGLPWLMALGTALVGAAGPYLWTPLAVGLLVWGTFVLAARDLPPGLALAAALLVAGSPAVLFDAMQTMSDLPVAALWVWALIALRASAPASTLGFGLLAALALAVRPNLVVSAGAVWALALAADAGPAAARVRRAAWRAAPLAAVAAGVAALNTRLWGSPFASGYGRAGEIFSAANIAPNLVQLWSWLAEIHSYWTAIGLALLVVLAFRPAGRRWWPAAGLVAGVCASYLPYARFAEWWYLRFYLPVWPVAAAALVVGARTALARRPDGATVSLVAAAGAVALAGAADAGARDVFTLWRGEQRYAAVGHYVADRAPADAVMVASQHSGALAHYTGRTVVRFDLLDDDLDALSDRLAAGGRAVWLVVDDWEEAEFRTRFPEARRGRLDWAPLAEARAGGSRVRIYDLAAPTRATGPAYIPVAAGGPWPWARRPAAAQ
ncbi:MAG: hypothetical protein AB7U83_20525 [Vicinamibacterales bacterium]